MSTYWHLRCADCGHDCDEPRINHGEGTLRQIASIGQHIAELEGERDIDYQVTLWGHYVPMWFFRLHRDHRLVLRSEYGQVEPLSLVHEPQDEAAMMARWLGGPARH